MNNFLAIRCIGNFAWPPVSNVASKPGFVEGVVEIHYVNEKPTDRNWTGCVRWIRKSGGNPGKPLPPLGEMPQLMEADDADLVKLFNDEAKGALAWHFDKAVNTLDNFGKLRFEGAYQLEQFDPSADAGAGPSLRFALVREHRDEADVDTTRTWYSSLQVGRVNEHQHGAHPSVPRTRQRTEARLHMESRRFVAFAPSLLKGFALRLPTFTY